MNHSDLEALLGRAADRAADRTVERLTTKFDEMEGKIMKRMDSKCEEMEKRFDAKIEEVKRMAMGGGSSNGSTFAPAARDDGNPYSNGLENRPSTLELKNW
eukprot:7131688-Pyramimonas_sp.AAC.1